MNNKKREFLSGNNIKKKIQHYTKINKEEKLKKNFFEIYDNECVYCKIDRTLGLIPFEIDHFIPKINGEKDHDIANLVCSCQKCNRNKSGEQHYTNVEHPDKKRYWNYWGVSGNYYTIIKEEYRTNKNIDYIYSNLRFETEDRRIINMYIELNHLKSNIQNINTFNKIDNILDTLRSELNMSTTSKI